MSIIRPPLRLRLGRLLIGLATAIAAVALIPAAAGGSPGHHLVFRLSGRSHQDVIAAHSIAIRARCPIEACAVVATATSKSPAFRTATVHARVPAGRAASLSLPLTPRERDKLKAAFKAGHSPVLTVKATARDGVGNRVPVSLTIRALRP